MNCEYGCGAPATVKFKSGKMCCSASSSSCPAMRKKNSNGVKSHIASLTDPNKRWKNGHPRGSKNGTSLKGKNWTEIYGNRAEAEKKKRQHGQGKNAWIKMTAEQQQEHRENARTRIVQRYEQGWMPRAGRCKKIKYHSPVAGDITVDGTWELLVAKHLDTLNILWGRNTKRFQYIDTNGKCRHYTPDFWVDTWSTYIEVKGYETELDRCKWSQFPAKLQVWKKDIISKLLESGQDGNAADC